MSRCCASEGTSLRSLRSLGVIARWLYWVSAWWRAAELPILVVVVGPYGESCYVERERELEREKLKEEKREMVEVGVYALIVTPHLVSSSCVFLKKNNYY